MNGVFILTDKEFEEYIVKKQKLEKLEKAIEIKEDVVKVNTKTLGKALELEDNSTFLFTM